MPEGYIDPHIHNCHIHTFTLESVPDEFVPPPFGQLMRWSWSRWLILKFFSIANPFDNRDVFQRFANFVETSSLGSQRAIFEKISSYYPSNTKFIILPMDMEYMGKGRIAKSLDEQHAELHDLSMDPKYRGKIIPFAAVDPRRPAVLAMLKDLVENKGFRGIKIYPALDYHPSDPILLDVYAYAQERKLPVMAHCSKGGIRHKNSGRIEAAARSHPHNYIEILKKFPALKLCLAHFGGDEEWNDYLENPNGKASSGNWLRLILDMIRSEQYPNLYTDISYVIFSDPNFINILNVLLQDPRIADHVLFGSDFYMVEQERIEEKKYSMVLRSRIGEILFRKIAEENPIKYLK